MLLKRFSGRTIVTGHNQSGRQRITALTCGVTLAAMLTILGYPALTAAQVADTDNDGVPDINDIDDDNDGITDFRMFPGGKPLPPTMK